jgi:protein-S-isoprenylcysteine O-methyltransferase Ste14
MLALKAFGLLVTSFLLGALTLFLPAGTLNWPAGWIFLILLHVVSLLSIALLIKHDPALLEERLSFSKPNQKSWDRILLPLFYLYYFVWLIVIALDVMRFHWSQVPLFVQIIGGIVLVASFPIMYLTFRENTFLSPMIRVQEERGQTVISTGPYHYVRHPLYSSGLLMFLGTTLLLGSWYGLLLGIIFVVAIVARALMEERMLVQELPGYDVYMTQVKYRLIPAIW